ncbi:MAG: hypothetical protein Q8L29_00935 [archaeon]|nr:hypothetical protein [archaeon]
MGWRTYLVMYFGTNGVKTSEIAKKLSKLGFVTKLGGVDFIYEWNDKQPTKEDALGLGDRVADVLAGSGAVFNLDTHD